MIASIPVTTPFGTAVREKARWLMDVILHVGAHRCATTSFQHYMRSNKDGLHAAGIGFWGPIRTRAGLFRGIQPGPEIKLNRDVKRRALGRVQLACAKTADQGIQQLVVSDENMLGTMRANIRLGDVYGGAGERMARFAEAFRGYLTDIVINIRSPELYWASTFGFFAQHGRGLPHPGVLERIAHNPRSWRDVIGDIACAAPDARLHVLPFERFGARPDAQLAQMTGVAAPRHLPQDRHNATPDLQQLRQMMAPSEGHLPPGDGRWMPFTDTQRALLRETYADDLLWLEGGADGLARLAEDPAPDKVGIHPPQPDKTRGRHHEGRHGKVARAG